MQRGLHSSATRPRGASGAPGPGSEPGQSNGGHGSDLALELWQVFVPLGLPVAWPLAYEQANALEHAFVVPVRRVA